MLSVSSINQRPVVGRQQNPNVNLNSQPIYKAQNQASKQNVAFGMEFTPETQKLIQDYLKDNCSYTAWKTPLIAAVNELKTMAPDYTCSIRRVWTDYWNDYAHRLYVSVHRNGDSSRQILSERFHSRDPLIVAITEGLRDLITIEHTTPGGIACRAETVKAADAEKSRLAEIAAAAEAKAKATYKATVDNLFA